MSPSYEKDTLKLHSYNHPVGFDGVTEFLGRIVEIRDSHDNLRKVLANVKKSRENKNKVRVNHIESSDPDDNGSGQGTEGDGKKTLKQLLEDSVTSS